MKAEAILAELERLLPKERIAIRTLDAREVDRFAGEKEALVLKLRECDLAKRKDLAPRLRAVIDDLRRNGVLLAHARDCLQDALETIHCTPPSTVTPQGVRPRTRLSISG